MLARFVLLLLLLSAGFCLAAMAEAEMTVADYMTKLQKDIKNAWAPPKSKVVNSTVVLFKIKRDGQVYDAKMEKSSGLELYDKAALAAVNKAAPFTALPASWPEHIDIEFNFDYNTFGGHMSGADIPNSIEGEISASRYDKVMLASILANHAVRATNAGKHDEAAKKYAALLHLDPKNEQAQKGFADAVSHRTEHVDVKDADKLLSAEEISALDGNWNSRGRGKHSEAMFNNEGVKALQRGNFEEAIRLYTEALKVQPNYRIAKDNLAIAYNNYGLKLPPAKALLYFYKSQVISPLNLTTAQNLAQCLAYGDPSRTGAQKILDEQKEKVKPESPADQHVELGLAYELVGDWTLASAEYKLASEQHSVDASQLLASIQKRKDAHELAKHLHSAEELRREKHYDSAVAELLVVVKNRPADAYAWKSMGDVLKEKGDPDRALHAFEKALQLTPNDQYLKQEIAKLQSTKTPEKTTAK